MTRDIKHEVNVISVLVSQERGVLLHQADSGKWGFPGSEDLVPGEDWESTQLRGLNRDLGNIEFENVSILHLESYPGGTVGPDAKFGVFVQMKPLLTEGLVHVRDMGNDYWEYDPRNYALVGSNTNQTIRLGDEVRVQIAAASVEARRIDLLFVE